MKISSPQLKTYWCDTDVVLVKCGKEFFDTLEKLIDKAKTEIQFQTYIYDHDETGKAITEALKRAANRGVKVFLVVDGFGSVSLHHAFAEEMKQAGIFFRKFSPLYSKRSFQVGRRLHQKVVVIDKETALVTGINIADKYYGRHEAPWLDFAVLLHGPICKELADVCRRIERKKITKGKQKKHSVSLKDKILVRYRQNDWVRRKNQIRESYKTAIRNAEDSITIVAAYFIPGITLRRALRQASERGVKIKLLLSGKSDVPFIKRAHHFLYGWLLHINVRVFEYNTAILHGKAMVVDNKWATIGSYNINHLSDYSSIELNADILSEDFARVFNNHIEDILNNESTEITDKIAGHKNIVARLLNWFSYQLVRINMSLLFFFITKRGNNRLE